MIAVIAVSFALAVAPGFGVVLEESRATQTVMKLREGVNAIKVVVPESGLHDALEISTELAEQLPRGEKVTFLASFGNSTLTWSMDSNATTTKRICGEVSSNEDHLSLVGLARTSVAVYVTLRAIDVRLNFSAPRTATVSQGRPVTFLVDPLANRDASHKDRYILHVESLDESADDVCMIVGAYGSRCPLRDTPDTIRNAEMWFTALRKGTMTIRYEDANFNMPFYVSIIVLDNDDACRLRGDGKIVVSNATEKPFKRQKLLKVHIALAAKYTTYVYPILMSIFLTILLFVSGLLVMCIKRLDGPNSPVEGSKALPLEAAAEDGGDAGDAGDEARKKEASRDEVDANGCDVEASRPLNQAPGEEGDPNADLRDKLLKSVADRPSLSGNRKDRITKGLKRLDPKAKLSAMTQILETDTWFRRNRSRVYCYLVPLISIFYFIPSIQFVFRSKHGESLTGSQDYCYHNFQCAKPLNVFSDFNHAISNISYMMLGLGFVFLVWYKAFKLPQSQNPKNDHTSGSGILQQLSIFYAMGFALTFQGFFSICYHVCPTNDSLQFDTTMMYVICMLGLVKLYQFRHPDANANAYSFFFFLGVIVFIEALALYYRNWWVYSAFILLYMATTLFIAIDCYYNGVGRLDNALAWVLAKRVIRNCNLLKGCPKIRYKQRFAFALLFLSVNVVYAIYIVVAKILEPSKTVSHILLGILSLNLLLYILYYVIRKSKIRCQHIKCKCRRSSDAAEDDVDDVDAARYVYHLRGRNIPVFLSAGSFFAAFAIVFGGFAANFYVDRSANRNLSPAESRNLNVDCQFFDFFDNHDMWHFTSAAAIFMAFLALLTVDDDFLNVPREEIEIF